MKKASSNTIISILFLFLFLSFSPPILHYPTDILPGMDDLLNDLYNTPDEMKEILSIKNKSKSEYRADLLRELQVNYFKRLLFVLWGLLGGILLLLKKNIGRYLVLVLSLLMFGRWFYRHFLQENHLEYIQVKFTMFFEAYPREVIHYDIAANIIYLTAIIFLLLPSTAKVFKYNQENNISAT